ncbi:MAG: hypothetical protein A2Z28_03110 [Chloroflexi bacterium RBG_16_51_9]|nr:MAG: hypothetical protein A2Z28_03110 [Chloroflexi bacterium RBG_16_51_9]HLB28293.1 DUF2277 domain-containing protein [Dehalococcoidales bacterium]
MCRNIKVLFNFEPPASEDEIRAAATQFVRKISGFKNPSKANQAAFEKSAREITASAATLLSSLATTASPKNRELEAARAHARALSRFGG